VALVKLRLRRLDACIGRLRARTRNAAGFDSRPFGRGMPRVPTPPSRLRGSPFSVRLRPSARPFERRTPCGTHPLHHAFEEHTMARIGAFCITTWLAAAILYFGQHSVAMIVLSGVVVFGGFDLLRP
jgi:hypothetical protein